ncbi:hypothetical protein NDAWWUGD_CDS0112 [Salmonella phage SeKF_80]|uniref:Uncharacterized protein n=2 Tax=Moazamivirus TaxID=3044766 RepID=G0X533_9CAUD|nr:hypothetical protein SaPh711_gp100 [Salmonella phage 7-11]YP_010672032.1 hypothetical protein PQC35_gp116 [Salmonella phage SE131]AEK82015.1 hypothetical protein [Salmonella phage 7-11]AVJ48183.1 hypothetical protein [Salmonella phage SE131]
MSDKDVMKELKAESDALCKDNLKRIGELLEEKLYYVNQMISHTNGELSLMMLTYHYSLIDDEIAGLKTKNRDIVASLLALKGP